MKLLSLSGGGTKIAGLFGAAEAILTIKKYKPDIIAGISAGAILSVPLALGKFDQIRELILNLKLKDFFSVVPITKDGKIKVANAIWRIIRGKNSLGEQKNLEKTLSRIVSMKEWTEFRLRDQNQIKCIVGSVNFQDGGREYVELGGLTYDFFLKAVNASSSIPIFTPGIMTVFDGGVRDHSPAAKVMQMYPGITEIARVYSRPENNEILDPFEYRGNNILEVLDRYVQITNTEVSKNDELLENQIIKDREIKDHGCFFLPRIMKGVYDVDGDRLWEMYAAGTKKVLHNWKT